MDGMSFVNPGNSADAYLASLRTYVQLAGQSRQNCKCIPNRFTIGACPMPGTKPPAELFSVTICTETTAFFVTLHPKESSPDGLGQHQSRPPIHPEATPGRLRLGGCPKHLQIATWTHSTLAPCSQLL